MVELGRAGLRRSLTSRCRLETMKMNKVHLNLDTMVQNITLLALHETGQLVLSYVFHGHIRQTERKLILFHSRSVTHKKARNNGKISGTARTEMVWTIGCKNTQYPCRLFSSSPFATPIKRLEISGKRVESVSCLAVDDELGHWVTFHVNLEQRS